MKTIIHSEQIKEAKKSAKVITPIDIEDPSYLKSSGYKRLVKVFPTVNAFNKEPSPDKSFLKYKEKMIAQLNGKVLTSGGTGNIRDMFVIDNPEEHTFLVLLGPHLEQHMLVPPMTYVTERYRKNDRYSCIQNTHTKSGHS